MQTWLVGGAVRDALLGLPVRERDWVVVGARPQDMEAAGFRQVGRDFPVFLHPETGEEHALARTERKSGHGHRGFDIHADPGVTLEQDLARRDLTINAIARADDGTLVDPCGGLADLEARRLRHVSPAFVEDPLRVLRVARFAATLAPLGFDVVAETRELMRGMADSGELSHLVPERVWQETERALAAAEPVRYFDELAACGALAVVMPELSECWRAGASAPARAALLHAAGAGVPVRWAVTTHGLAAAALDRLQARLRVPRAPGDLASLVAREWHRALVGADAAALLELLRTTDALRRPERFDQFRAAIGAIAAARDLDAAGPLRRLALARAAALEVDGAALAAEGWSGADLGRELDRRRRERIAERVAGQGGG